jgi:hypothetical protein
MRGLWNRLTRRKKAEPKTIDDWAWEMAHATMPPGADSFAKARASLLIAKAARVAAVYPAQGVKDA